MEDEKTPEATGPPVEPTTAEDPAAEVPINPDEAASSEVAELGAATPPEEREEAAGPIPIVVDYGRVIDLGHLKDFELRNATGN